MGIFTKTIPLAYHQQVIQEKERTIEVKDSVLQGLQRTIRQRESSIESLQAELRFLKGQHEKKCCCCKTDCAHVLNAPDPVNIDEYQERMSNNNVDAQGEPVQRMMLLYALGLTGESGEVADYIKKVSAHGMPMNRADFVDELGDVLWYLSQLAFCYGIKMSEVMEANRSKVLRRYPSGFRMKEPAF